MYRVIFAIRIGFFHIFFLPVILPGSVLYISIRIYMGMAAGEREFDSRITNVVLCFFIACHT